MNTEPLETWLGLPFKAYSLNEETDYPGFVHHFGFSWEEEDVNPLELFAEFLADYRAAETKAISLGLVTETGEDVHHWIPELTKAREHLTGLRGIFLGHILQEESEISWIEQGDISQVLADYPRLEALRVRGQTGLRLTPCGHDHLTELAFETGGLASEVLRNLKECRFPELERLELWLGTVEYGWDGTIKDLLPFLNDTNLFPKLKHLAIGNSDLQNEIAQAAANAPVVAGLASLDLSLGVMDDAGGMALLGGASIRQLRHLNVRRNYLTSDLCRKLEALGPQTDTADQQEPDVWDGKPHYYVQVGE